MYGRSIFRVRVRCKQYRHPDHIPEVETNTDSYMHSGRIQSGHTEGGGGVARSNDLFPQSRHEAYRLQEKHPKNSASLADIDHESQEGNPLP